MLCFCPTTSTAEPDAGNWQLGLHDISAMSLIAGAQDALAQLELDQRPAQRTIYLTSAMSALSALYQLHGFEWAMERLLPLYNEPGCPDIHFGYSTDGRIRLTVEPMELRNPVFNDYTVMLVTIESNSGELISAESFSSLSVELQDGVVVLPDYLSEMLTLSVDVSSKSAHDLFDEPRTFINQTRVQLHERCTRPDFCQRLVE